MGRLGPWPGWRCARGCRGRRGRRTSCACPRACRGQAVGTHRTPRFWGWEAVTNVLDLADQGRGGGDAGTAEQDPVVYAVKHVDQLRGASAWTGGRRAQKLPCRLCRGSGVEQHVGRALEVEQRLVLVQAGGALLPSPVQVRRHVERAPADVPNRRRAGPGSRSSVSRSPVSYRAGMVSVPVSSPRRTVTASSRSFSAASRAHR